MKIYKVILVRNNNVPNGFLSNNSVSTDAFNAISSIPGTKNVKILKEAENEAEISYEWTKNKPFLDTEIYLSNFGVCKKK